MIQKLRIQLKTLTPPGSHRGFNLSSPIFTTPQNPRQLEHYNTTIKDLIYNGDISPSTFKYTYEQLVKSYRSIMAYGAIIKKQYNKHLATNEKEKQKCQRSKKQLLHDRGITSKEAQELIQQQDTTTKSTTKAS